jgi:crotonobetainyl-CoA:carnitine CoA-transferase CaiB-like acyl-CoA transferase
MGYIQPRLGSGIPYSVPRGTYRCADGKWVAISTSADSIAARVLDLIGLGGDERFASFQNRSKNREVLETYVRDWVAQRPSEDVIREFRRVDAAIAPVLDMADIFRDPHYLARAIMTEVDGIVMQNVVARFSKTPAGIRHAGRKFGANTEEVVARLVRQQQPVTKE